MTVNVLGTEYTIIMGRNGLPDDMDGYCDETVKIIRAENYADDADKPGSKADLTVQTKKVLRHEITHAFLFESGLAENSPWAQNEEVIDWIAAQAPKLIKAWQEAGAI